jgi:hypothetical protein
MDITGGVGGAPHTGEPGYVLNQEANIIFESSWMGG